jgi:hypothetical protein
METGMYNVHGNTPFFTFQSFNFDRNYLTIVSYSYRKELCPKNMDQISALITPNSRSENETQ